MPNLVKINANGKDIWIESDEKILSREGPQKVSNPIEDIVTDFNLFSESIQALCNEILQAFNEIPKEKKPSKITAQFGLNLNCEGNVYIVKAAAKASLVITAEWQM